MPIIFIAGLTRSGTTFLQSQLLQYENVVALGEVSPTINAIRNVSNKTAEWKIKLGFKSENYWNTNTYSLLLNRIKQDSFWQPIEEDIRNAADLKAAIELVYTKANEKYPGHILVDSSKHINYLLRVMQSDKYNRDIKVILCIRDYRGWLYSVKKHQKRLGVHQRSNLIEIYKWLYSNKKLIKYLSVNLKGSYKIISYERLALSYQESINDIAFFCNLKNLSGNKNEDKFHEILGSQSLKKSMEEKVIRYDYEWFRYNSGLFDYPVQSFNKRIYSDISK